MARHMAGILEHMEALSEERHNGLQLVTLEGIPNPRLLLQKHIKSRIFKCRKDERSQHLDWRAVYWRMQ